MLDTNLSRYDVRNLLHSELNEAEFSAMWEEELMRTRARILERFCDTCKARDGCGFATNPRNDIPKNCPLLVGKEGGGE